LGRRFSKQFVLIHLLRKQFKKSGVRSSGVAE
jgi:hypothetical protein